MPEAEFFSLFRFFVRRQFLEAEIRARFLAEVESATRTASTVQDSGAYVVDRAVRSTNWIEAPTGAASLVESRLLDLKPAMEEHFRVPLSGCDGTQFLSYKPGDFYLPHRDVRREPALAGGLRQRQISVVIFLNSQSGEPRDGHFCGGSLTFYGLMDQAQGKSIGLPLEGRAGLLVAFPSAILHGVAAVTYGERFTIVSWYI